MSGRRAVHVTEHGQEILLDATLFESWQEYIENLDAIPCLWSSALSKTAAHHWSGDVTYAEARRLAEFGWPEGTKRMLQILREIEPYARRPQQRPQWEPSYAGFLPSMPAYVAGAPDHMLTRPLVDDPTRSVVRIISNSAANAGAGGDEILNRGAAIVSLVDFLEGSGTRVELSLYDGAQKWGRWRFETMTLFKRAEQPLDLDRVAFALAHPSVLRRLQFRIQEQCVDFANAGTYGGSTDYTPEADEVYFPLINDNGQGYRTPQQALNTVIAIATDALGTAQMKEGD